MRRGLLRTLSALGMAGLLVGVLAPVPAGAEFDDAVFPSLTVTKTVVANANPYPVSGVFEVQVICEKYDFAATLTFQADGSVDTAPDGWVGAGNSWTYSGLHPGKEWDTSPLRHGQRCEIVEVESEATAHLATTPTYACSFTNEPYGAQFFDTDYISAPEPGCASPTSDVSAVVQFGDPRDKSCPQDIPEDVEHEPGDHVLCVQSAHVTVTNTIASQTLHLDFTG